MEKFIELAKGLGLEKEEGEEMLIDSELFMEMYSLFESMSRGGKETDDRWRFIIYRVI